MSQNYKVLRNKHHCGKKSYGKSQLNGAKKKKKKKAKIGGS